MTDDVRPAGLLSPTRGGVMDVHDLDGDALLDTCGECKARYPHHENWCTGYVSATEDWLIGEQLMAEMNTVIEEVISDLTDLALAGNEDWNIMCRGLAAKVRAMWSLVTA